MGQNVSEGKKSGENNRFSLKCLSATEMKLIALITMTIDHIGAALLPQYSFLRVVGRVAFPIYCYMIVNGLFHTKSSLKYVLRLIIFALISEVFFDLAFFGSVYDVRHQNVFFTLATGLSVIALIEKLKIKCAGKGYMFNIISYVLEILILLLGCFIADALKTDYSFYGVLMIYGFYMLRFNAIFSCVFQIYMNVFVLGGIQAFAITSLPIMWMYNGEKGEYADKLKWLFYVYYPAHLFVIYLVKQA